MSVPQLVIALIGPVSSGKTSFLNALIKIFNPVSVQRETRQVIQYLVNGDNITPMSKIQKRINRIYNQNKQFRNTGVKEIQPKPVFMGNVSSPLFNKSLMLLDFPGLYEQDGPDRFIEENKDLPHIFIFVTSIESAFSHESELRHFERLLDMVKSRNSEGYFSQIVVVVNKYDDEHDPEYAEIVRNLPEVVTQNANIFRMSSHRLLCYHIELSGETLMVPEQYEWEFARIIRNSGAGFRRDKRVKFTGTVDTDKFLEYINTMDICALEYKQMHKSLMSYDCIPDGCGKLERKLCKLYNLNPSFGSNAGYLEWISRTIERFDKDVVPYPTIHEFFTQVCEDPILDDFIRKFTPRTAHAVYLIMESVINREGRNIDPVRIIEFLAKNYDICDAPILMGRGVEMRFISTECAHCRENEAMVVFHNNPYCLRKQSPESRCIACENGVSVGGCGPWRFCNPCMREYAIRYDILVCNTILSFQDNEDDGLRRIKTLIHLSKTSVKDIVSLAGINPGYFRRLFKHLTYEDFVARTMQLYHEDQNSTHGAEIFDIKPDERLNELSMQLTGEYYYNN